MNNGLWCTFPGKKFPLYVGKIIGIWEHPRIAFKIHEIKEGVSGGAGNRYLIKRSGWKNLEGIGDDDERIF